MIRLIAGMDSIIQAAGRCNRNGEFARLCPVYIVNPQNENLGQLKEIREAQTATEELLASFAKSSERFANDLQSNQAIQYYYHRLFANMPRLAQDYPIPQRDYTLIQLLSGNYSFWLRGDQRARRVIGQAFRTAGEAFHVFEENTSDVIVPYGEGKNIIDDLCSEKAKYDFLYRKGLLDKAKKYTVSLFDYALKAINKNGGLNPLFDGAALTVLPEFYQHDTGINVNGRVYSFLEV